MNQYPDWVGKEEEIYDGRARRMARADFFFAAGPWGEAQKTFMPPPLRILFLPRPTNIWATQCHKNMGRDDGITLGGVGLALIVLGVTLQFFLRRYC